MWWKAQRHLRKTTPIHRARSIVYDAIYFEFEDATRRRNELAHLLGGKGLGLPAGYGYSVKEINPPPDGLVPFRTVEGTTFFWVRRHL